MKKVIFEHNYGFGEHNTDRETFEFEDDTTEDTIRKTFEDWVWYKIGDSFSYYDA